jgi:hypothetical protein
MFGMTAIRLIAFSLADRFRTAHGWLVHLPFTAVNALPNTRAITSPAASV